jgi:hypothetical protein
VIPSEWQPVKNDFIENAHKLIIIGYQGAVARAKSGNYQEPAITGFIAEAIDDWLESDASKGFDGFDVHDDPPEKSYDGTRTGRERKRSDLVIKYTTAPRKRFACEAKRLNTGRGSEYIGVEGMGCFISGGYARPYSEVGMLGYVETKSLSEWKAILCKEIESKVGELELIIPQTDVNIIPEISNEWRSQHSRSIVGNPVFIFHILLDFIK